MKTQTVKKNKHEGSDFDDWLKEEGLYEGSRDRGFKKALAAEFAHAMKEQNKSVSLVAREMKTSRTVINRILDEQSLSVSVRTIYRAAAILGKRVKIELVEA
jgi:DNA invertase Pin-like site-specific DNA recombinase